MLAAEVRPRKGPSGLDLTNPVLRALDSRQPCVQIGSALAGIQVPPLPLLRMVVHRGGLATLRTRPAGLGRLLDPHVHPFGRHIQSHLPHHPARPQLQQSRVQLGVFHYCLLSLSWTSERPNCTASLWAPAALNSAVAGAEDRARQGCDLSADPGAGTDREGATLAPTAQIRDQFWHQSDKSWGSGGKAPSCPDSPHPVLCTHLSSKNSNPQPLHIGVTHAKPGRTSNLNVRPSRGSGPAEPYIGEFVSG